MILCACLLAALPVSAPRGQEQEVPDPAPESDSEPAVRRLGDVDTEEYQLDLALPKAPSRPVAADGEISLPDPEQDRLMQDLLKRLAANPANSAALAELDTLLDAALAAASVAMQDGDLAEAGRLLGVVRNVNPRKSGLPDAEAHLAELRRIGQWLSAAHEAMENGDLIEPAAKSAQYYFRRVLHADPGHPEARKGLIGVQQALVERATDAARSLDFESAEQWLQVASGVREPQDLVEEARRGIAEFKTQKARDIEREVIQAAQRRDFDYAEFALIDLIALGGQEDTVRDLRERINRERVYGQFVPGQVIQDQLTRAGGTAPAVIVLAPGSFMMGSPERERGREESEEPQHRVNITRSFAMGMQEVTVGQFRTFVEAAGYQTEAEARRRSKVWDDSLGRLTDREHVNWRHDFAGETAAASLPVLHVSWRDAQAYLRWLSGETGANYRLPSEAEFEFAMRAGSTSPYWWGDNRIRDTVENLTGERDESASLRQWGTYFRGYSDGYWGPAPAGSFPPNPNRLYDMAGNVSEWVQDCWHPNYLRAPGDGSAWENPGCTRRVIRGGYWASAPAQARSAARLSAPENLVGPQVGFRIARDL